MPTNGSANEVLQIVELVKPLLAGKDPEVQGAVLAELLSLHLAGYWIKGNQQQTQELRDSLLIAHCAIVQGLTEVNAEILAPTCNENFVSLHSSRISRLRCRYRW
jgi:hypothetical protein